MSRDRRGDGDDPRGTRSAARVKQLRDARPDLERIGKSGYTEWEGRDP